MYKNNFVLTILHNNQPLREMKQREVYLPFDSEYSLLFENRHNRRACARIKIDGTDVMGGDDLIIDAHQSVSLERFLVDGNLNEGNRFKFVRANDSRVSNPGSPENGLIEVEFWLEQLPIWTNIIYTPVGPVPVYDNFKYDTNTTSYSSGVSVFNMFETTNNSISNSAGATIEGSNSNQKFTNVTFGVKEYPSTTMKIWLRGLDRPLTTKSKLYCVECGKQLKPSFKFCPSCATPVVVE